MQKIEPHSMKLLWKIWPHTPQKSIIAVESRRPFITDHNLLFYHSTHIFVNLMIQSMLRKIIVTSTFRHRLQPTWWSHQMETLSALLVICAGNSQVTGEFPAQRPVTWSFDVFFDLRLNKQLIKQWRWWWFETPSRSLWRHCIDHASNCLSCRKISIYVQYYHVQGKTGPSNKNIRLFIKKISAVISFLRKCYKQKKWKIQNQRYVANFSDTNLQNHFDLMNKCNMNKYDSFKMYFQAPNHK